MASNRNRTSRRWRKRQARSRQKPSPVAASSRSVKSGARTGKNSKARQGATRRSPMPMPMFSNSSCGLSDHVQSDGTKPCYRLIHDLVRWWLGILHLVFHAKLLPLEAAHLMKRENVD